MSAQKATSIVERAKVMPPPGRGVGGNGRGAKKHNRKNGWELHLDDSD